MNTYEFEFSNALMYEAEEMANKLQVKTTDLLSFLLEGRLNLIFSGEVD